MNKIALNPVKLLILLLALIFSNAAFSQDDIIMLNNDVVKAKVDEVGMDVIKYRKLDNLNGPQYDLPKANVYMIIYANGSRDVINAQPGSTMQNSGTEDNLPAPPDGVNPNANVSTAPPPIPTYEQPICPTEGYIWTPGYWAYGPLGYYWVPGVWLAPARPGYLWTPGYWYLTGGFYRWHGGYWGEHIGYYGGVYYGYGYTGSGYYGGRWEGGYFRYNTAVSNVNVTVVHNTYVDKTVVNNTTVVNRASYNGAGGVTAEPTVAERAAVNEQHINVTPEQQAHVAAARSDQSQYVSVNKGTPAVAAMNKPGGQAFSPAGQATVAHPNTVTPAQRPATTQPLQQGKQSSTMQENKPAQATPAQKEINAAPPAKEMNSTPAQKEISSAPATQTKVTPNNTAKQNIKSNQKSTAKKTPRQAPKQASHTSEHR